MELANKVRVTGVTERPSSSFRHVSGVAAHVRYEGGVPRRVGRPGFPSVLVGLELLLSWVHRLEYLIAGFSSANQLEGLLR